MATDTEAEFRRGRIVAVGCCAAGPDFVRSLPDFAFAAAVSRRSTTRGLQRAE